MLQLPFSGFRRQGTIEKHLEQARQRLAELGGDDDEISRRTMAARQRAAREKLDRMQQALGELEKVRETRSGAEKDKARVSLTDPEARIMNQSDNGFAPSYNVQVTTDAKATVVVSVDVTQDASDARQLQPAVERLQEEAGQAPKQVIADGGYTNRENVVAMAAAEIDLVGPARDGEVQKQALYDKRGVAPESRPETFRLNVIDNTYTCPMGKTLHYVCKCTLRRADEVHLPCRPGRLSKLPSQGAMLWYQCQWTVHRAHSGRPGNERVPVKDGNARGKESIQEAWGGRGVSAPLDQGEVRPAAVFRPGSDQSKG